MSYSPNNIIKKAYFVFTYLGLKYFIKTVLEQLFSINHFYILQRNLNKSLSVSLREFKFTFCRISSDDFNKIFGKLNKYNHKDIKELLSRILFYDSGFKNCYVIKNDMGDILCLEWLIYPSENHIINSKYSRTFKELRPSQVMLENVFTFPEYRGLMLVSRITSELMNIAKEEGYKNCITYVNKNQVDVLNQTKELNFKFTDIVLELKLFGFTFRFFK